MTMFPTRSVTTVLMLALCCGVATAAEVKLVAVNAAKEAIVELAAGFERASGHKVSIAWGGSESVAKRVSDGEIFDVVMTSAPNLDRLIGQGKLLSATRSDVAKTGVGIAVRAGAPKPDVSTPDALKKAVLEAKSVAYSTGPSGFYLVELFKKMGIAEQIKDKVKQPPSGTQIAEMVARGEADLGFQQVSELVHAKGIAYLGPLPAEIQNITVYAAAAHANAASPDAAKALIAFLTAPSAAEPIRKMGLEPK
jgi:molybdate transport system substrate-binding protein